MSYFAPYVDATGLHIPTYDDILQKRIADFKSIYGQDCYLDNDSADYQEIAVQSLSLYDAFQTVQLLWNQMSPATAIGAALALIVRFNGIKKKSATYSTCLVTLTGNQPVTIINGQVKDKNGNLWNLPPSVQIVPDNSNPTNYIANVLATCAVTGKVTALAGDISLIVTPTTGWTSVTNAAAATAGLDVESDSALRVRQSISVSLPSLTRKEGTAARIATIAGVTRYKVYENPTNSVDGYGHPVHSITCVVEGGAEADIVEAIRANKSDGCYTNGDIAVATQDSQGVAITIRYYRQVTVPIYATLHITGLTGYTSATTDAIKTAVAAYLNSLQIGECVTISAIYGAALSVMPTLNEPMFSVTAVTAAATISSQGSSDITMTFDQVASGDVANIDVVVS
jgi:uncharacterized phage protein gp47/JayE